MAGSASTYGSLNSSGVNTYGFKPQGVQDSNQMANFLQSSENSTAATGAQQIAQGQGNTAAGLSTTQSGIGALGPALQYLTQLTKGDQGDISQAIQPEANRIKDSFTAVRSMISGQPRGGGKAGALADATTKQAQQISDTGANARSGAAGQLGQLSSTLAGIGINEAGVGVNEQNLGLGEQSLALQTALQQRGQNNQERAANQSLASSLTSTAVGALI